MKRHSPYIYSRSRAWALICSSSLAVLGIMACLLWLARDVSAVTPRPSAAAAPPSARLYLGTPAVFTYPLTSTLDICDTFGPRLLTDGVRSRYTFHLGVDWCAADGVPVHAVTTGTVQSLNDDCAGTAACFVHLTHAAIDGQTRYDHLSGVAAGITTGLQITPGEVIGWVGSDGDGSPAYLHFEVHDGLTVTERAAIHPLRTPFLPWTNAVSPTVALAGVYTDSTGMTALVQVTSPYTEPDLSAVSVVVTGTVSASRTLDFEALNAAAVSTAALNDPLAQVEGGDVCLIPTALDQADGYRVTMAFRQLDYGSPTTVTASALDVDGGSATATLELVGGLAMAPPTQTVAGGVGRAVTLIYTLTNRTGAADTFTLTHLSAQGWPASLTPPTATLADGQSVTVTARITISTDREAPDCGLVVAQGTPASAPPMVAGFYRLFTHVPLSGVDVAGPKAGVVNELYTFTATVAPPTTTLPVTYTWRATGQSEVTASVNDVSHAVAWTWTESGVKGITVTAANGGGAVTATHRVTVSVPPAGVSVAGPTAGV
ncbi:MAG TPA: M23 family metallopeptidase, partial [Chloroflexi bacterium]|nr:M23 family metallopeptidase [Chloroflexota bacterium]